jgi:hypothetical protein
LTAAAARGTLTWHGWVLVCGLDFGARDLAPKRLLFVSHWMWASEPATQGRRWATDRSALGGRRSWEREDARLGPRRLLGLVCASLRLVWRASPSETITLLVLQTLSGLALRGSVRMADRIYVLRDGAVGVTGASGSNCYDEDPVAAVVRQSRRHGRHGADQRQSACHRHGPGG